MSGGVDSSVVAALLHEQGHEVIGVHMKLHDAAPSAVDSSKRCCGYDDALDARKVADHLGIPFYVMNLREAFQKAVMDDLANAYVNGQTPNPCVQCNGVLKFKVLLSRAMALGADRLATGHYAQIRDGVLHTAADSSKDQTYFLYPVTREALSRTLFPLGGMTKPEVRAEAERLGLITAAKPESQEICFIPDDDHTRFVREAHPELDASGEIVDESGQVLGRHDGYYRYTIGQRRGLQVALGKPAYVLKIEPETRRVVVGFEDRIFHSGLVADRCNWYARPEVSKVVHARIRHRGGLIPCQVGEGDVPTVHFLESARAVTPGQSVVFYDGEQVLGGGTILKALDVPTLAAVS